MTADPFAALGLPARPDLTDDDVRAAWRRVAAATHPDRADGGDPARFAVAAAAYTELRTRSGRGEAYADLAAGPGRRPGPAARIPPPGAPAAAVGMPGRDAPSAAGAPNVPEALSAPEAPPVPEAPSATGDTPVPEAPGGPRPARGPGPAPRPGATAAAGPGGRRARGRYAAAGLAARIRRGRPALLAFRVVIAAGIAAAAFAIAGAQPAAAGLAAGALTWLLLTGRHDLLPPGS